jgi:hypothetical protein
VSILQLGDIFVTDPFEGGPDNLSPYQEKTVGLTIAIHDLEPLNQVFNVTEEKLYAQATAQPNSNVCLEGKLPEN